MQLRFASILAEFHTLALVEAVFRYTNFHRRFGLGTPDAASLSEEWRVFTKGLELRRSHQDRLDWIQDFYLHAPPESLPEGHQVFGCFSLDYQAKDNRVRIHFQNCDSDSLSPLHASKAGLRKAELRRLFGHVKTQFPDALEVMGVSWLYNHNAYRRLFPPAYGESRVPFTGMTRFQGSSGWGQFLRHDGNIKDNLKLAFLAKLESFDASQPWTAFPLCTYVVKLDVQGFYRFYDL